MIWLRVSIGGQRWKVHLVGPKSKHMQDGEERLHGWCDAASCNIYISNADPGPVQEDTLIHELLHAVNIVTGVRLTMEEAKEGLEEEAVTRTTPTLHRLLCDLGFRAPRLGNPGHE